jgi:hypothetical protein
MIRHLAANVHYTLVPISAAIRHQRVPIRRHFLRRIFAAYHALKPGRSRRTSYSLTDPA